MAGCVMDYYDSVRPQEKGPGGPGGPGGSGPPGPRHLVCRRGSWPPARPEPHLDNQIVFTGGGGGGQFRITSDCVSEVRAGLGSQNLTRARREGRGEG